MAFPEHPNADAAPVTDGNIPERVRARPRSSLWSCDELITLPEAATLFWPHGPVTLTTLRTAVRDGDLHVARIAGKFFTTKAAIGRMTTPRPQPGPPPAQPQPAPAPAPLSSPVDPVLERIRERQERVRSKR
jgi:hypothetical protein